MRQKIRRIASVTLGFTIAIAPLPQASLGHLRELQLWQNRLKQVTDYKAQYLQLLIKMIKVTTI